MFEVSGDYATAEHHWSLYSPNLICMDVSFWPQAQEEIARQKPQILSQLKAIVEDFAHSISEGQLDG